MSEIGKNILRARRALGWSQEELAQRMGYKSRSSINKIEAGIADIPQSKIAEFADVLGTTPAALLGLVDEATQSKTDEIARIVVRMRSDPKFRKAVARLNEMDEVTFNKTYEILGIL
jgi:transcriptional regulator with XRE-family HTH domain